MVPLNTKYIAALILVTLDLTASSPAKNNARPVIEIINEQARIDENVRPPGVLPYGNPLAGNSKQNARLHAQNQQAMFNAERIRQHRAQLQRWTKAPQQEDSYMKAYHESQENHQLALEQQQQPFKDTKLTVPKHQRPASRHESQENHQKASEQLRDIKQSIPKYQHRQRQVSRPESQENHQVTLVQQQLRDIKQAKPKTQHRQRQLHSSESRQEKRVIRPGPDIIKITKEDAVLKENNRNHRSYGSVEYPQYLQPKLYQTVVTVAPGPTYDQGVTIKPNGNVGLASLSKNTPSPEESQLFTAAIPSKTQYIYPKTYGQMQNYHSAYEIDTLNSLLKKPASEQLTELNALINSEHVTPTESTKVNLETPIDLYFYLKDSNNLPSHYDQSMYAQIAPTYASKYTAPVRDHTPITEEVDDIEDPNKNNRLKALGIKPVLAIQPQDVETTTTKSNNYYKVEVASQTISSPYKSKENIHYYYNDDDKPHYEIQNAKPTYSYYGHNNGDSSERYLHHNAQHTGIQHLTEDGTGISHYNDDDLHYAANYEFGYRVRDHHSGNDFGHQEAKRGSKTNGHYHVLLPDGRMQKVHYSAGPEGFHADISYDHLA